MKIINKKLIFIFTAIVLISFFGIVFANAQNNESNYVAKTYIDNPTGSNVGGNIVIDGWVMTNDSNSKIKAYIDGKEAEILSLIRKERYDVLEQIKGYGTIEQNKQPGIRLTLNCTNLSKGKHTVSIKVFSRENKEIAEFNKELIYDNENSLIWVDTPLGTNNAFSGNYTLRGWVMANTANSKIKIYINNQEQPQEQIKRVSRKDVLDQIKGYGSNVENPNPGFEYIINCSNYVDGTYPLKIVVLSENGKTIGQYTDNITIQKYKAKTWIDYPKSSLAGDFAIEGWFISNDEKSTYKLYLDDVEQKDINFIRTQRNDVLDFYKEYNTEINKQPGIICNIDSSKISKGKHKLTLKAFSREGNVIAEHSTNFTLEESRAKICIDKPSTKIDIVGKTLNVVGWVMSNDKNTSIKAYIDGKQQNFNNLVRLQRNDVLEAIKDTGTKKENPTPGFKFDIDLSKLSNGTHTLKIDVLSGEGKIIKTQERKFILDKYTTKLCVDFPINNDEVSKSLFIKGWVMSTEKNAKINIYIDNQKINDVNITRQARPDVINAIKGYGTIKENPTPGFEAFIDTTKIKDGKHTLKIVSVVNNEETQVSITKTFSVKKYQTSSYIDDPAKSSTRESVITIRGWVMSELANKKVIIKIDGKEIGNIQYNERPDVISAIKGYGTIKENPKPEFKTTVDLNSYGKGTHNITIQVYSNETNEVIHEQSQNIVYLGKIERETIKYGYSGAYLHGVSGGSELICYKYGDGPNVLFATFCVHGYEDSWDRDGEILVKTANDFYDRLIKDQDYSIAEKWTIYIFPEVNPDGRRLGQSKNGPGRTTLYSKVGKGIDINRCWQTGTEYERFTSDRNYNGTEGFQAYEAEYLRDFILAHKTNVGQNVLIDFHGWENQLIGDESVCKYYKEQYPSCRTTGYGRYGSQYIISWARLNIGAKVALVELPLANSMAEALSMKLPEKYITATLNFLRGM